MEGVFFFPLRDNEIVSYFAAFLYACVCTLRVCLCFVCLYKMNMFGCSFIASCPYTVYACFLHFLLVVLPCFWKLCYLRRKCSRRPRLRFTRVMPQLLAIPLELLHTRNRIRHELVYLDVPGNQRLHTRQA